MSDIEETLGLARAIDVSRSKPPWPEGPWTTREVDLATALLAVAAERDAAIRERDARTPRVHKGATMSNAKITVNGSLVDFEPVCISYEQVVALAGFTGTPSVTYSSKRDGDVHRQGTMYTGCSPVLLTDAMVFNVAHTGNA